MFSFLAVKSKIAGMADGLTWKGIVGVGILSGLGFTVSLFISGLSFEDGVHRRHCKVCGSGCLVSRRIAWLPLFSVHAQGVQWLDLRAHKIAWKQLGDRRTAMVWTRPQARNAR